MTSPIIKKTITLIPRFIKNVLIFLSCIKCVGSKDKGFLVVFIIIFHGNRHTPFSKIRKSFTEFYNMYLYHQQLQQTKCLNSKKEMKRFVFD